MARVDEHVATRRKEAIARFLDEAQWVAGDFGFKVPAPAAHRDAEVQRIALLEYAADVLGAVRESRQAARQDKAPAKAEAPKPGSAQTGKPDKPDKTQ